MRRGAIILCGGQSSRMGVDKALLPFGPATMLERIVETIRSVIPQEQIVVVAGAEQQLPSTGIAISRDSAKFQGPLPAIVSGLETLAARADTVFVTGCDSPLLRASVIDFLFDRLDDFDCVVPRDAQRLYPLCAVYRCSILSQVRASAAHSLHELVSKLNPCELPCDELRAVDPELTFLGNVNTHDDYVAALAAAGLSTP